MIVWTIILTLVMMNTFWLKLREMTQFAFLYLPAFEWILLIFFAAWITWEENNAKRAFTSLRRMLHLELLKTANFLSEKTTAAAESGNSLFGHCASVVMCLLWTVYLKQKHIKVFWVSLMDHRNNLSSNSSRF